MSGKTSNNAAAPLGDDHQFFGLVRGKLSGKGKEVVGRVAAPQVPSLYLRFSCRNGNWVGMGFRLTRRVEPSRHRLCCYPLLLLNG